MERPYQQQADAFCEAIRNLAANPEALDNLESYLSCHFAGWLEHMADTPDKITDELKQFIGVDDIPF